MSARRLCPLLIVLLFAGAASAVQPGAVSQEPEPQESAESQAGDEQAAGQEQQEPPPEQDPTVLARQQELAAQQALDALPENTTDAEEEALRLVEEILREQNMLLTGQAAVYRSGGRRDPFRNLLQVRQRELVAPSERPVGLAGFLISEIQVQATARYQGRWHALVSGLDRRTYFAAVGTSLYDGSIVEINEGEVVFEQEVEDLLGARSTRRVIKKLTNETEG